MLICFPCSTKPYCTARYNRALDIQRIDIRAGTAHLDRSITITHCRLKSQASPASFRLHLYFPIQNAFLFVDSTCGLSSHDIYHRNSCSGSPQEWRRRRRRWRRRHYYHHKGRSCISKSHNIQFIHLCGAEHCERYITHLIPETRILTFSKPPPTDGSAGTSVSFSVTEAQCTIPSTGLLAGGALTASLTATPKTGTVGCKFSPEPCLSKISSDD